MARSGEEPRIHRASGLIAPYFYPETQLGVPQRLGIASAISFRLLPRGWRGVPLWVPPHLSLTCANLWLAT